MRCEGGSPKGVGGATSTQEADVVQSKKFHDHRINLRNKDGVGNSYHDKVVERILLATWGFRLEILVWTLTQ